jgi:Flp pilus assembly protein TadG
MKTSAPFPTFRLGNRRGQNLVEFAMVALILIMLVFGVIEIGRVMLVYTTISNAARVGTRYAIVNGSDTSTSVANVQSVVNNYLAGAPIDTTGATVTVGYPDTGTCKDPGCRVTVTVSYPYEPMLGYYNFNITLHNTSEGVITW